MSRNNTSTKSSMYGTSHRKRSLYSRRSRNWRSSRSRSKSKSKSASPDTKNENKYSGLLSFLKSLGLIVVSAVVAYLVYSIVEAEGLINFLRELRTPPSDG